MKERFENEGRPLLMEALKPQEFVLGNEALADALTKRGQLVEYTKGDRIITEGGEDTDVYLLLAGSVTVVVKGNEIRTRHAGQHVGEMAAIEPSLKRSGTNVANETVVALKITSADFNALGKEFPRIWLPIAQELARRLFQRNDLIHPPNEYPKLFLISSAESLPIAHEIQGQLRHDVFSTTWDQGIFFVGGYSLEALEKAVKESDFAVAVAEPDDIIESRGGRFITLRDNVLFELGIFMGVLSRYRAILVHPKVDGLKLPSDLQGLTLLSYTPNPAKPEELPSRLAPVCNDIRKMVKNLGVRKLIP